MPFCRFDFEENTDPAPGSVNRELTFERINIVNAEKYRKIGDIVYRTSFCFELQKLGNCDVLSRSRVIIMRRVDRNRNWENKNAKEHTQLKTQFKRYRVAIVLFEKKNATQYFTTLHTSLSGQENSRPVVSLWRVRAICATMSVTMNVERRWEQCETWKV